MVNHRPDHRPDHRVARRPDPPIPIPIPIPCRAVDCVDNVDNPVPNPRRDHKPEVYNPTAFGGSDQRYLLSRITIHDVLSRRRKEHDVRLPRYLEAALALILVVIVAGLVWACLTQPKGTF